MKLNKLYLQSFRNLEETVLTPARHFNIFFGNNGQGKTNLLESIFILATMKSFKTMKNSELVQWGNPRSLLKGWVERDGLTREIAILLDMQGKKIRVDRKTVSRIDDFFGQLNVVLFTPEEVNMVKGLPEQRRRYLDRAVFSSDVTYLSAYQAYGKVLKNRNALLKKGESCGLDIWTEQLVEQGKRLIMARVAYIHGLRDLLGQFYREISGNEEIADIRYKPHRFDMADGGGNLQAAFTEALAKTAREEERRGTTLTGPHRDDVEFTLNGKSLKQFGSQGQQKTYVLALKMAETEYMSSKFHSQPVFLLDDISSELDQDRKRNLMDFLKKREMQVFITTTSLQNIVVDRMENYRTYRIEAGRVLH
ncbi:DNA replication/repair protein RecF [Geotalea sp. SG265]|uniref:DNA replication/repair protein RecF n=1 Tax=Geotalea sp. SG265 TaxID=2922867 RepID=UPI0024355FA9|nr:DNA replication/repair protein RecF [Geotalea sp. SG265]